MPIILAFRRQRQENHHRVEASLVYIGVVKLVQATKWGKSLCVLHLSIPEKFGQESKAAMRSIWEQRERWSDWVAGLLNKPRTASSLDFLLTKPLWDTFSICRDFSLPDNRRKSLQCFLKEDADLWRSKIQRSKGGGWCTQWIWQLIATTNLGEIKLRSTMQAEAMCFWNGGCQLGRNFWSSWVTGFILGNAFS